MKQLIGILTVALVVLAVQYTPISKVEYGLTIGDPNGDLHIQAVYDLLCEIIV
jgi:hypothetical protein